MSDRERNHVNELEHIVQHNEVPLHVIVEPIAGELPWKWNGLVWTRVGSQSLDTYSGRYAIEGWLAEKVREEFDPNVTVMDDGGVEMDLWDGNCVFHSLTGTTYLHALVAVYLKIKEER